MQTGLLSRLKTLSPYAGALLQGPATPQEAVIRAELFGRQRFEEHGRSLARAQPVVPGGSGARASAFFPRVNDNLAMLRRAYDYVAQTFSSGHYVTPAAEWLLDNFHLVEDQFQQIHEGVPRRYYADLPKLATPPLAGLPRVYGIAWAYVAHTDSVLTPELFMAFLEAYQQVDELTLGELWALPTTLRVVLLENLRRVAEQIAAGKVAREVAHAVWDAAAQLDEAALDAMLARMRALGLQRAYLAQLWQRLPAEPADAPPLADWIARLRAQPLWTLGGIVSDIVVLNSEPNSYRPARKTPTTRPRSAHSAPVSTSMQHAPSTAAWPPDATACRSWARATGTTA